MFSTSAPLYRPEDSSGVLTREPPQVGSGSYGVLEMQVDADGNDLAGIRSAFLQTPIGTYTGWNLGRKDRSENGMCNLQGSFIPFASTKAERIAAGDPRLRLRSGIRQRKRISRLSTRPRAISWRSASCCRTTPIRWSRPLSAKAFETRLRGRLQGFPVLRCRR